MTQPQEDMLNNTAPKPLTEAGAAAVLSDLSSYQHDETDPLVTDRERQYTLALTTNGEALILTLKVKQATHLIKTPQQGLKQSHFNELFSMYLASRLGLKAPEPTILWIKKKPYYFVGRIDRTNKGESLDMTSLAAAGSTPIAAFNRLNALTAKGIIPGIDRLQLFHRLIFKVIIGSSFEKEQYLLIKNEQGGARLAPPQTIISNSVYGNNDNAILVPTTLADIAVQAGFRRDYAEKVVHDYAQKIKQNAHVLRDELNKDLRTRAAIYDKIIAVIDQHAGKIIT